MPHDRQALATVLPEMLAVIGCDYQYSILHDANTVKLRDQPAELVVEVRDAVLIRLTSRRELLGGAVPRGLGDPGSQRTELRDRDWPPPRAAGRARRRDVGIVGVEIVQEGEEGPGTRPADPAERVVADPLRVLADDLSLQRVPRLEARGLAGAVEESADVAANQGAK